MKPKKQEMSTHDYLFRKRLEQILDQRHALYRLVSGYPKSPWPRKDVIAHARQMQRARREQKRLKAYLGRVMRDIERKVAAGQGELKQEHARITSLLDIARRIHAQQRHDKGKVYSVHARKVECIAKGKAHKPYEFGVKVGVVSTSKESFIVGMQALPGNPYDGHTLKASLTQTQRLTGMASGEVYVDRGYRGHGIALETLKVWIADAKRGSP